MMSSRFRPPQYSELGSAWGNRYDGLWIPMIPAPWFARFLSVNTEVRMTGVRTRQVSLDEACLVPAHMDSNMSWSSTLGNLGSRTQNGRSTCIDRKPIDTTSTTCSICILFIEQKINRYGDAMHYAPFQASRSNSKARSLPQ